MPKWTRTQRRRYQEAKKRIPAYVALKLLGKKIPKFRDWNAAMEEIERLGLKT